MFHPALCWGTIHWLLKSLRGLQIHQGFRSLKDRRPHMSQISSRHVKQPQNLNVLMLVVHIGGIADKLRSYDVKYAWVLQAGVSLQTKRPWAGLITIEINLLSLLLRMGTSSWSVHPQIRSLSWVKNDGNQFGLTGKREDVPVWAPAGAWYLLTLLIWI